MNTPEQIKRGATAQNFKTLTWYKVTSSKLTAIHAYAGYKQWWRALFGGWHIWFGSLVICEFGLHATLDPRRWMHPNGYDEGCRVFEVKVKGFGDYHVVGDKAVFRAIKFVREIKPNSAEWVALGLPNRAQS